MFSFSTLRDRVVDDSARYDSVFTGLLIAHLNLSVLIRVTVCIVLLIGDLNFSVFGFVSALGVLLKPPYKLIVRVLYTKKTCQCISMCTVFS